MGHPMGIQTGKRKTPIAMATDTSGHWLMPDQRPTFTVTVLNSPKGKLVLEWAGHAEDEDHARAFALQAARIARQVAHLATGAPKRTRADVVTDVIDLRKAAVTYKGIKGFNASFPDRRIKVGNSIVGRPRQADGKSAEAGSWLTPQSAILAAQAAFRCAAIWTPVGVDGRASVDFSRNWSGRTIAYGVSLHVTKHMGDDARMTDPLRDTLTACSILLWMKGIEVPSPWAKLDSATLQAGKHAWKMLKGDDDLKVVTDFLGDLGLDDVARDFAATYGTART